MSYNLTGSLQNIQSDIDVPEVADPVTAASVRSAFTDLINNDVSLAGKHACVRLRVSGSASGGGGDYFDMSYLGILEGVWSRTDTASGSFVQCPTSGTYMVMLNGQFTTSETTNPSPVTVTLNKEGVGSFAIHVGYRYSADTGQPAHVNCFGLVSITNPATQKISVQAGVGGSFVMQSGAQVSTLEIFKVL